MEEPENPDKWKNEEEALILEMEITLKGLTNFPSADPIPGRDLHPEIPERDLHPEIPGEDLHLEMPGNLHLGRDLVPEIPEPDV